MPEDFNGLCRLSGLSKTASRLASRHAFRHYPAQMQAVEKTERRESFEDVIALTDEDMAGVDRLIESSLSTDVELVSQVSRYIVMSGGKRLRPLIVLLACRALGYVGEQHYRAAAIIEFIHTATLLHDDVVDSSERRRGRDSANAVFGNEASVLVGDFLYSRAFQMMVSIDQMRVMQILADATNTIAAGEVMQLMNVGNPDLTEADYEQVIYRKTAKLFEAGAQLAAVLADQTQYERALADYGRHLGTAFQLVDDALDFNASAEELGKNLGDDIAEGKPTLPIIRAMERAMPEQRELLRTAILEGGLERLESIQSIIESTEALQYTAARAQDAADKAIAAIAELPDSDHKQALIAIADFAVHRRS
jgi:octaprenyl-diphosphate synthase